MASQVKIGTTFHSHYADSNPRWKVIKRIGGSPLTWLCECEGIDFEGTQKAFTNQEIISKVGWEKNINRMLKDHDGFWDTVEVGDILHMDYRRCKVVEKDGRKGVVDIALVGEFPSTDLPRRMIDGSIFKNLYADRIDEGEWYQPNPSNFFEYDPSKRLDRGGDDPRTMEPLDLTLPEPTEEEVKEHKKWQKVNEVRKLLEYTNEYILREKSPDQLLSEIQAIVGTNGSRRLFDY